MFEDLILEISTIKCMEELQSYTLKAIDLYSKKRINFIEWCTASAHLRVKQAELILEINAEQLEEIKRAIENG